MSISSQKTRAFLQSVFGKENVLYKPMDTFGYSYDASPEELNVKETPHFVVKAHSAQEISQLMRFANEHKIPVVPRGTGSGRSGGAIPTKRGIVVSLDEMQGILEYDADNMMVTVEAGVKTKVLHDYCAARGLFYPPDPSSYAYSTIAGNIAENAGGIKAVKYGVTGDYVMGLEVVLPNGDIIETGGKMKKNVTGYNLTQLFVGSEGTLGIITKATLRLVSLPQCVRTAQAMFVSVEDACRAVSDCLQSGVIPTAAELMDKLSLDASAQFNDFSVPEGVGAMIVFDVDGPDEATVQKDMEALHAICAKHGIITFTQAKDQQGADIIWALRRKLSSAVKTLAPDRIAEDISVPRSQLPVIVKMLQDIADKNGFQLSIFGHAGDGNLHPSFLADLSQPGAKERMHQTITEAFAAAVSVGGTLSGEHGIGVSKQPYIQTALSPETIRASLAMKHALDPNNILNPGKIF